MPVKALYPGTFDPPTNGHVDLIQRGSKLFDHLTVAILVNPVKNPLFTVEERVEMLEEVTGPLGNVSVATFDGLMVEFARKVGAAAVLRGIRAISDYEHEFQMALMNRRLAPDVETVFLAAGGTLLVCELADGEGSFQLWRRHQRAGAAERGEEAARADQERRVTEWRPRARRPQAELCAQSEICQDGRDMTVTAPAKVFADRIGRIEVSATMAVAAEAAKLRAQGANLVDFGAGEPHFATPRHIKDAAIAAIEANFTRYTVVPGIPDVRKAIVERHACDFGSDYTIDEAVFTSGGKLALFNTIQVLVDHGDEVILPVPYWVSFKDIIQYAGGTVVFLETSEAESFRITADAIEQAITPRTKAIILNSPSNPAGSVVSAGDLERIVHLAHDRGIFLLLDECYVYLNYAGKPVSGGSFTWAKEHIVILGSLSKTYSMTGWRAGYALAAKPVAANLSKLQSQSTSNATSFVQKAAIAALSGSQECVAEFRAEFIELRDYMLAALKKIPGVTCTKPEGAFYVYPNISAYLGKGGIRTATELATRLLHEGHVVTVPGEAFGTAEHVRISYPVTRENIDEGTRRMGEFLTGLK